MAPPPAAPGDARPAVQHVLHAQVDVVPHRPPRDLDAVRQRRHGAVGPARPAVLGDVLVEGVGQEGLAADVAPVPAGGEVALPDVPGWGVRGLGCFAMFVRNIAYLLVGKRRVMIVGDCVPFQYLQ